jgi:lipopolysaccharide biosynthesis glycosyltransferase
MKKNTQPSKGVIVACDQNLEWLLPWWWFHFSAHNDLPVAFIDFGMSSNAKSWCKNRGLLIPFKKQVILQKEEYVDIQLLAKWKLLCKYDLWQVRQQWFKKPLAFALSPFDQTVWLDMDCEVRDRIEGVFSYCDSESGIALRPDYPDRVKAFRLLDLIYPDENYFNSGVVVFKKSSKIIKHLQSRVQRDNHLFLGDQCLISRVLHEEKLAYQELPIEYHCFPQQEGDEVAKIYHWCGRWGKKQLKLMVENLQKLPFTLFRL